MAAHFEEIIFASYYDTSVAILTNGKRLTISARGDSTPRCINVLARYGNLVDNENTCQHITLVYLGNLNKMLSVNGAI